MRRWGGKERQGRKGKGRSGGGHGEVAVAAIRRGTADGSGDWN